MLLSGAATAGWSVNACRLCCCCSLSSCRHWAENSSVSARNIVSPAAALPACLLHGGASSTWRGGRAAI